MENPPINQDRNIKELSASKFILIVTGRDSGYIFPNTHQKVNEDENIRIANERGEEPWLLPITIPDAAWLSFNTRQQILLNPKHGIDLNRPIVNKIIGNINLSPYSLTSTLHSSSNYTSKIEYFKSVTIPRKLELRDCYFYGLLSFQKVESEKDIIFNGCKFFPQSLDASNYELPSFTLDDCKFNSLVIDGGAEIISGSDGILEELILSNINAKNILLSNVKITKVRIDTNNSFIEKITISNCSIKDISIIGENAQKVNIVNLKNNENISIDSYTNLVIKNEKNEEKLEGKSKMIGKLNIDFNEQIKGSKLFVDRVFINSLILKGVINGSVVFKNCVLNNIVMVDLSNLGDLRFHGITNIKSFLLEDVSLGKAHFMNVSVNKAEKVQIMQSTIYDINLINTVFPVSLIAQSKDDFLGIKEIFRQLKLASSKQGDNIRELEYKAIEMDAYGKDMSLKKSFVDKFILFANKYSNAHGINWRRALVLHLIMSISLFVLIKIILGYTLIFSISYPDFDLISEYLNFSLNPLHEFGKVFYNPKDINLGLAKCVDAIAKFFSAYLLFQFLQAFRKYSK